MADETVIETIETAEGEKVVTPVEKRFTQAELDKVVKDRLERERVASKAQKEALESDKSNLQSNIEAYESKLKDLIAPSLESIPDEFKPLVEKLSLLEQVEFINSLSNNKQSNSKKFIPSTPKAGESDKQVVQRPVGTII